MTRNVSNTLDIAIIGGGITGLVCAAALAKKGVHADIYESKAKFGEIGAGVGIGPNAVRILEDIGVMDDLMKACGDTELNLKPFKLVSALGSHETIADLPRVPEDYGHGCPRWAVVDAMMLHINHERAHFNKKCIGIETSKTDSSRSVIKFADGTSAEADVVLAADGINSGARGAVTGKDPEASIAFSNEVAYRFLVPMDQARAGGVKIDFSLPLCFVGIGKHAIVYPIDGGRLINVAAFKADRTVKFGSVHLPPDQPTVVPVGMEELLTTYEDCGEDFVRLIACATKPNKWLMNVVYPPLETYAKGRIALLGDAAHAMLPHLGAGAGQGIEDAYLISLLLTHPETTKDNLEAVLRVYDEVRRPHAQQVWDTTCRNGHTYQSCGEHGPSHEGIRQDIQGVWDFVWHHPLHADRDQAISRLRELGVYRK